MPRSSLWRLMFVAVVVSAASGANEIPDPSPQPAPLPALKEVQITSTLDNTQQPSLVWIPESAQTEPRPVLIFLHSWSGNYKQNNSPWQAEAVQRNWIYLHPNFRGANFTPEAGGSLPAQQDILDALAWVKREYKVDPSRVYLAGTSGGGYMSLLMAGRHAEHFSAVSAWVPISDLAEWYRFHTKKGVPGNYAKNVATLCGGVPGESPEVDAQYHNRSPIHWLAGSGDLPIDINAGVNDGHAGSVPVAHSLSAFNVIAAARNAPQVSEKEMQELWAQRKLSAPRQEDIAPDDTYKGIHPESGEVTQRAISLRRHAGPARVTIFAGGHEGLPVTACAWLEKQTRHTSK